MSVQFAECYRAIRCWQVLVLALLLACRAQSETADRSQEPSPPGMNASTLRPASGEEFLIRSDGIGAVRAGMTLGEFRSSLPAHTEVGSPTERFMVDVIAIPVLRAADTLYYLLFSAGTRPVDGTRLELVATNNASFRTREGVGPGTRLADAASVYGLPTLSYSIYNESREYARFPQHPAEAVAFRVAPHTDGFAGVYTAEDEYNDTNAYKPGARIMMVEVRLSPL